MVRKEMGLFGQTGQMGLCTPDHDFLPSVVLNIRSVRGWLIEELFLLLVIGESLLFT